MYINVDPYSLKGKTVNIDNYINDFESGIQSINNTVSNISSIWRGNDFNYFNDKMQAFIRELVELEQSLQTFNNFIKGYIEASEKLDIAYQEKKIELE